MNEEHCLLWLLNINGMTRRRAAALIDTTGSAEAVWESDGLGAVPGLPDGFAKSIAASKDERLMERRIADLERKGIKLLALNSPGYPALLKEIHDPPLLLYMLGKMPGDKIPRISVIGSRDCSEYGLAAAYKLSRELADSGVIVVSGLARGIDSMAHKAALDSMDERGPVGLAPTVAVLGCGVDVCYPPENRDLYDRLTEHGCIISEFPPGTKPLQQNFPSRNRIISGLSLGVAVVEAAARSGTSITVGMALDQGRDVFALPGSIFSRLSVGTNDLLKSGAIPITGSDDILWAIRRHAGFGYFVPHRNETGGDTHNIENNTLSLAPDEKVLYACIGMEPVTVDDITRETGFSVSDVQYILTKLELAGAIRRLPGQRYIKAL